ncbi:hypothetical protein GCM10022243_39760 [Saccharothrix violaceirubra]
MSAVLVLLAVVLAIPLGVSEAGVALLGVLGWLVALAARLPALASAGRLPDLDRSRTILESASAITDEVVRSRSYWSLSADTLPRSGRASAGRWQNSFSSSRRTSRGSVGPSEAKRRNN